MRFHGRFLRVSKNLREWHAFAVALSYPDKQEIKIVIASAGDWTKNIISRSANDDTNPKSFPKSRIWLRRIFGTGFMYSINAYKNVFIIATGSGIAPVLPYIQTPTVKCTILWIAKDHAKTFGDDLMLLVKQTSQTVIFHDTKLDGRPTMDLIFDKYNEFPKLEAIFIVSNEPYTNEVINEAIKRGVPCYGALFDS